MRWLSTVPASQWAVDICETKTQGSKISELPNHLKWRVSMVPTNRHRQGQYATSAAALRDFPAGSLQLTPGERLIRTFWGHRPSCVLLLLNTCCAPHALPSSGPGDREEPNLLWASLCPRSCGYEGRQGLPLSPGTGGRDGEGTLGLKWRQLCPPGDIWRYLDTFLFVKVGRATCVERGQARDAAKCPAMHRTALHIQELPDTECQ